MHSELRQSSAISVWCGGWVIQDGVYPDFSSGQMITTAFEFGFVQGFQDASDSSQLSLRALSDSHGEFQVTGRVTWANAEIVVVDTGLLRLHMRRFSAEDPPLRLDSVVEGKVRLGLSPWIRESFFLAVPATLRISHECRVDRIWKRSGKLRPGIAPEISRLEAQNRPLTEMRTVSTELVEGRDALLLELTVLG